LGNDGLVSRGGPARGPAGGRERRGSESPEKRCGKTTLLAALGETVRCPVIAANISPSALFRLIDRTGPTLLIDEAGTFLPGNHELRGILNSGYSRKTAYVAPSRTTTVGPEPAAGSDHFDAEPLPAPGGFLRLGGRAAAQACQEVQLREALLFELANVLPHGGQAGPPGGKKGSVKHCPVDGQN
jgi:hypothetical protein